MNGPWIGRYYGTNSGFINIDIDYVGTHFGRAYANDDEATLPASTGVIRTNAKNASFELTVPLRPMMPPFADPREWADVATSFPVGSAFSDAATVKGSWDQDALYLEAITNIGTSISARPPRSVAKNASDCLPLADVQTWEQFQWFVKGLEERRFIFRGQNERWASPNAISSNGWN